MSYFATEVPACSDHPGAVTLRIESKTADLGDFSVRRSLPARARRMIGPFVFFDHMGPAEFPPGKGIAVRPHPHIGIATITYLFDGQIIHRDSLGVVQPITPGAVNLMISGRGIVHSERAGDDLDRTSTLHGIQSWIALPVECEEMAPDFTHYGAGDLPLFDQEGARVRVIMGEAYGHASPVRTFSRTLYLEVRLPAGASLTLPDTETELAFYVAEGRVEVEGDSFGGGVMAVGRQGAAVTLHGSEASRVMVLGGDPVGPRKIFWNFVSSRPERIEQAKEDWKRQRFAMVPDDDEFIPLPE